MAAVMTMSLAIPSFAATPPNLSGDTDSFSIEITNANDVVVNGETFNAYKIFDVTYNLENNAYKYAVAEEFNNYSYTVGNETYNKETLVEYVSGLANDASALNAFAIDVMNWAVNNNVTPAGSATGENGKATINLTEAGYYLVTGKANNGVEGADKQTVTAACILTTTNPDVTIAVKADAPSIDKVIDDGTPSGTKHNNVAIGDNVSFKITSAVPKMDGYEKYFFVVNDTMSKGLTLVDVGEDGAHTNDFTVKIGDTELNPMADYSVRVDNNEDGTTGIKIVFNNFIERASQSGQTIEITYSAILNEDAVIGVAGNPNAVNLVYSNNPNVIPQGENEPGNNDGNIVGQTPDSETRTYVTGLQILKTDNRNQPLAGAEFTLTGTELNKVLVTETKFVKISDGETGTYYLLKDGTYTDEDPITEGENANVSKYAETTPTYKKVTETRTETTTGETKTVVATSGPDGIIKFEGLMAGTYTISETKVPDGYTKAEDVTLNITWTAPTTGTDCTWYFGNETTGNVVDTDGVITNNTQFTAPDASHTVYETNIVNVPGSLMPSTGGIGTTIFYVLGGLMVAGAGILLVTKRRMSK